MINTRSYSTLAIYPRDHALKQPQQMNFYKQADTLDWTHTITHKRQSDSNALKGTLNYYLTKKYSLD